MRDEYGHYYRLFGDRGQDPHGGGYGVMVDMLSINASGFVSFDSIDLVALIRSQYFKRKSSWHL
ncbi:hypothetical protein [Hydrogenophaga sp. T2]|uniref:hypothetical protein n=1 Tax=Hydrogenophaga sp. T2 TaxID=3132823 RepID=UPI003CF28232